MSRSIHALVSKKATNKEVLFNGRLSNFVSPPIHNGDLYITRDLHVGRNSYLKDLDISGNLTVSGVSSLKNTDISGNLSVSRNADISGNLIVSGVSSLRNTDISGNLAVSRNADISGNMLVYGTISARQYTAGQVIRTFMYSNTELNQLSDVTIVRPNTNTVFTINYTPVSAFSYIFLEYQTMYVLNGSSGDQIYAYLHVNGGEPDTEISFTRQSWNDGAGGGTRSGTIFPIVGRYTNSNTSPKAIRVDVYNGTDADTITINSNKSTWLKITEVGR